MATTCDRWQPQLETNHSTHITLLLVLLPGPAQADVWGPNPAGLLLGEEPGAFKP